MNKFLGRYSELFYFLMRVVVGVMFAFHGTQKLFGMFGGQVMPTLSLLWFAGVIEFFGGLLIAAGVLTSTIAFIAAGEMAVAYFRVHQPQGPWPILNRGELAVLYCFVFLYIASRGGGRWSLTRG